MSIEIDGTSQCPFKVLLLTQNVLLGYDYVLNHKYLSLPAFGISFTIHAAVVLPQNFLLLKVQLVHYIIVNYRKSPLSNAEDC